MAYRKALCLVLYSRGSMTNSVVEKGKGRHCVPFFSKEGSGEILKMTRISVFLLFVFVFSNLPAPPFPKGENEDAKFRPARDFHKKRHRAADLLTMLPRIS